MERKTKIVATIGPASANPETIQLLLSAGMNVARINFSHGSLTDHAAHIALLRSISQEMNKPLAILQDLQGPKIRVGDLPEPINLVSGTIIHFCTNKACEVAPSGKPITLPVDLLELPQAVHPGNRILLDDGRLELEVESVINANIVSARVITGGMITSNKGVNLPNAHLTIPCMTEKDHTDLKFGLQQGVDIVAMSFVRTVEDILTVRKSIEKYAPHQKDTPIIAKLERPEALENLESILDAADGVMVARGDLGVEMSPAIVPIAQKRIIEAANRHLKIVITATQMLESMIQNPRPTRAEASDVANAIFDGTDAVMLSGETAIGKYPVDTVLMMGAIACQAEEHFIDWGFHTKLETFDTNDDAVSLTRAAKELAHDRNVAAIAVFTQTGHTALLMSKARPGVPILAFTPDQTTYNRLSMMWGVIPHLVPFANSMERLIEIVEQALVVSTKIKPGQQVVLISGFPVGEMRPPNFALLHTIGISN